MSTKSEVEVEVYVASWPQRGRGPRLLGRIHDPEFVALARQKLSHEKRSELAVLEGSDRRIRVRDQVGRPPENDSDDPTKIRPSANSNDGEVGVIHGLEFPT